MHFVLSLCLKRQNSLGSKKIRSMIVATALDHHHRHHFPTPWDPIQDLFPNFLLRDLPQRKWWFATSHDFTSSLRMKMWTLLPCHPCLITLSHQTLTHSNSSYQSQHHGRNPETRDISPFQLYPTPPGCDTDRRWKHA